MNPFAESKLEDIIAEQKEETGMLIRDFNRFTIEKGVRHSKKYIKSLDCIDLREIMENGIDLSYMRKYVMEHTGEEDFFSFLPCFEEGVFRLPNNAYLYFKIRNLLLKDSNSRINIGTDNELTDKTPDMINGDYCEIMMENYKFNEKLKWCPGLRIRIVIRRKTNDKVEIATIESDSMTELYACSTKTLKEALHWTDAQITLWSKYIKAIQQEETEKQSSINTVIQQFCSFKTYINLCLQKKKLSHGKKSRAKAKYHVKTTVDTTAQQPEKLIRNISIGNANISFTSRKTPKRPDEEYIRHYSVAAWKTRGHLRHYKNGKTVWIKESVHKRKGFENNESAPQSVLQIKQERK